MLTGTIEGASGAIRETRCQEANPSAVVVRERRAATSTRRNARHVACLRCTQISGMPVDETVRSGPEDKSGVRLLCSASHFAA